MVGFAAGGTTDFIARLLAHKLPEPLRLPVVAENRTDANGSLGPNTWLAARPIPPRPIEIRSTLCYPVTSDGKTERFLPSLRLSAESQGERSLIAEGYAGSGSLRSSGDAHQSFEK